MKEEEKGRGRGVEGKKEFRGPHLIAFLHFSEQYKVTREFGFWSSWVIECFREQLQRPYIDDSALVQATPTHTFAWFALVGKLSNTHPLPSCKVWSVFTNISTNSSSSHASPVAMATYALYPSRALLES